MAKTPVAAFAQVPKTASQVVTGAATVANDTPANTLMLFKAGADGAIMTRLRAMPRATATATSLVLFVSSDGGVTKRLVDSELMPATTVNATTAVADIMFANYTETSPLRLGANDEVYVGAQVALAAGIVFVAEYTDF